MQIAIVQHDKPAKLSIECTAAGRQALSSSELTARERQLLLLLDKETDLSLQAITHLLQKIDINTLANKGWVNYQLSTQTQLGKNTAVINQLINVKFVNSVDTKAHSKRIKSFLNKYSAEPDAHKPATATLDTLMHDDNEHLEDRLDDQALAAIESEIQAALNDPPQPAKSTTPTISRPTYTPPRVSVNGDKSFAYEPVHDSFEDIMIAQSLLGEE